MLRVLLSLFLASVVLADTQKCPGTEISYYSYAAELPAGQTTDKYFQCMQTYFEETGISRGKSVTFVQKPAISDIQWRLSPYQEDTGCTNCLAGCQSASADPNQVCKVLASTNGTVIKPTQPQPVALKIKITIEIGPVTITISWGK